ATPCRPSKHFFQGFVAKRATLKPVGGGTGSITIPVGRSRLPGMRRDQFLIVGQLKDVKTPIRLVPSDFIRSDHPRLLPDDHVGYTWTVDGNLATIRFCFD